MDLSPHLSPDTPEKARFLIHNLVFIKYMRDVLRIIPARLTIGLQQTCLCDPVLVTAAPVLAWTLDRLPVPAGCLTWALQLDRSKHAMCPAHQGCLYFLPAEPLVVLSIFLLPQLYSEFSSVLLTRPWCDLKSAFSTQLLVLQSAAPAV